MRSSRFIRIGLGLLVSFPLFAANPNALIREQALREQQQLEQLQSRPDIFLPAPKADIPPEKEETAPLGPCFDIQQIQLQGAPPSWLAWLAQPAPMALPTCMHTQDIKALLATLANRILARGYVTSRVDLPEQNLQQGVLQFTVQPGYIGAIRNKEGQTAWALRSAFSAQAGDILNIRAIEQGLEQLARPMSQQAQVEIAPGEALGTSDIVVNRDNQFPLSAGLSWDNTGQKATGRWQLGAHLVWDRPLQLNDVLILSINQDSRRAQNPGSRGNSLAYTLPWGNWIWGMTLSQYQYQQSLGMFQFLSSTGHTKNANVSLRRLLHRNQTSKTELTGQFTQKISHNYLGNIEISNQRRRLSLLGVGLHHRHYLGPLIVDAQIEVQRGVGWLNAEDPLPPGGPNARARVYSGKLNTHFPFQIANTTWRWSSEWRWQYSPDILFGSEQLTLGNHYTVRGFQHGLAGNSGQYWRNDVAWSVLPPNRQGRALDVYIGADVGRISNLPYTIDTHTVAGWTIGIRGALSKHAHAELSLESPLQGPVGLPRERVVYFRIAING